jgi:tRNA1Val (adenine37-N6)-methyltransferase
MKSGLIFRQSLNNSTMQVNKIYTIEYSQPLEYRFSLDSVFLAQRVADWLFRRQAQPQNIADLCAGCGVVGLELLFHLNRRDGLSPQSIDFIEIQNQYVDHFEKNKTEIKKLFHSRTKLNFLIENYQNLIGHPECKNYYDLIIGNPPYFLADQGKLSPSEFKNRCRFFLDSDFSHLIKYIGHSLAKAGSAFLLMREDTETKARFSVAEIAAQNNLGVEVLDDVRGTKFIRFFCI